MTLSIYTIYSPKIFEAVGSANWYRTGYHSHLSGQVDNLLHKITEPQNIPFFSEAPKKEYTYKRQF